MSEAALDSVGPRPLARFRLARSLLIGGALLALLVGAVAGGWWWRYGRTPVPPAIDRGWGALQAGDMATARQCLRELRAAEGHGPEATLLRGAMLVKLGYYYPGIDELSKLEDHPRHNVRALTLIGEAWYYLGRHMEAQVALQKALAADPDAIDAHRWLAASYYDMGAITGALPHLERTAELDPTDQRPLRLLGLVYKDFERYEDAVPCYQESLRRQSDQPDWDQVRQELATCQLKLRRHRDALATLQPCPRSPAVLVLEAEARHALDETDKAIATLQQALAADPRHVEGRVLLGSILLEEGKQDEAIEHLKRAAEDHPKDYMAHFKLAQAYEQAAKPALAAAERKTAEHLREVRKLFADLHQAAWDNPEDMRIRLRLAQLAHELGRPDLEQMWLKAAAALEPMRKPSAANQ